MRYWLAFAFAAVLVSPVRADDDKSKEAQAGESPAVTQPADHGDKGGAVDEGKDKKSGKDEARRHHRREERREDKREDRREDRREDHPKHDRPSHASEHHDGGSTGEQPHSGGGEHRGVRKGRRGRR